MQICIKIQLLTLPYLFSVRKCQRFQFCILWENAINQAALYGIRGFHKRTKLAIVAIMPTLYSHVFTISFFIYII